MQVETRATDMLSEDERQQVDALNRQSLSEMPPDNYTWFTACPYRVMVKVDGIVVSTLGIVVRTITVGGRPVVVGGIGDLGTLPAYRRRGYARAALDEAIRFMGSELGVEFGFLFCEPRLVPFYSRLGWQPVNAPLTVEQPAGKILFPEPAMFRPCGEREWPSGPIDLCGLPF